MQWQIIVSLIAAIPIILLPVALVWYLNLGGVFTAIKEEREKRALRAKGVTEKVEID